MARKYRYMCTPVGKVFTQSPPKDSVCISELELSRPVVLKDFYIFSLYEPKHS